MPGTRISQCALERYSLPADYGRCALVYYGPDPDRRFPHAGKYTGAHIYIVVIVLPDGTEIPFYVGQTTRLWGLYKPSENPRKDEHDLIREMQVSGPRLINGLAAYDYKAAEPETERHFIHRS